MTHNSTGDPVFDAFCQRQHAEGMRLAEASDILKLIPFPGDPGTRYIAEFHCKGLARKNGRIEEQNVFAAGISFPRDYLRRAVDVATILCYLGPAPQPWHPNITCSAPGLICMHIAPGAPLVEILHGLYELFTWSSFSTSDEGLNRACSQWYRHQNPGRFPLDHRPLKRRAYVPDVQPLVTEAATR